MSTSAPLPISHPPKCIDHYMSHVWRIYFDPAKLKPILIEEFGEDLPGFYHNPMTSLKLLARAGKVCRTKSSLRTFPNAWSTSFNVLGLHLTKRTLDKIYQILESKMSDFLKDEQAMTEAGFQHFYEKREHREDGDSEEWVEISHDDVDYVLVEDEDFNEDLGENGDKVESAMVKNLIQLVSRTQRPVVADHNTIELDH
ncbi:hypothetical protein M011DRAFT_475336 [Sporormia fimetaria CBS 119925]|uniref:Uncharacterized protein n=1 Tax=Sporormia fimetaria CBS 119925 TaxID=1340428 RepID=A0A6A6VJN9_9PLEO|nr:hypothetical protein M011DRAFT_475336 [Sporormia fimetaria CBS 119925]